MGKGFVLGVILTVVALSAAAYVYFEKGFVDIRADSGPSPLDSWLGSAMDASVERHAPKASNPAAADEGNVVAGARLYRTHCAGCHGTPAQPKSRIGLALNPSAPQFFGGDPADMPENQNVYIIQNGVRFTGMPAWKSGLSDQEIWQIVDMLAQYKKLPAAAQTELESH